MRSNEGEQSISGFNDLYRMEGEVGVTDRNGLLSCALKILIGGLYTLDVLNTEIVYK